VTTSVPRLRGLLARPGYRRLWIARTVSQVGDVAQFTTLALLLVHLTGSAVGVTGAVLAEIAAVLLIGPLAGSLVDRLPRVRVMITADLVRVLLAASLALWHANPAVAYTVAFGLAAGQAFFGPASQSLLPALVADEEIVAANSGIWTAAVSAQVLVAPVAALLATRVGFGGAFAVNAVSFALSAAVLTGLHEPARARPVSVGSPFAHVRDGLGALAALLTSAFGCSVFDNHQTVLTESLTRILRLLTHSIGEGSFAGYVPEELLGEVVAQLVHEADEHPVVVEAADGQAPLVRVPKIENQAAGGLEYAQGGLPEAGQPLHVGRLALVAVALLSQQRKGRAGDDQVDRLLREQCQQRLAVTYQLCPEVSPIQNVIRLEDVEQPGVRARPAGLIGN